MPIAQFSGERSWGYNPAHIFSVELAYGGPLAFKKFVKRAHSHGIAVILDVVYNHYVPDGERAQWQYDSTRPENNIYFWYEGQPSDYPNPDGGYIDNMSTGFAPRYHEDMVRKLFVSSAVALVIDFHIDGFRVEPGALDPGKTAKATLHVPDAAPFFRDHFPRRPVFPATLLLNEMINLALAAERAATPGPLLVPVRMTNVKVRAFTPPGQVLDLCAELTDAGPDMIVAALTARADRRMVATARVDLAQRSR